MDFQPFDPSQATEEDFREIYDLAAVRFAADWPEMPPTNYDGLVSRIKNGTTGTRVETLWLARVDGVLVGMAYYEIYLRENRHFVYLAIGVHPDRRGQGIGTAFLRVLLEQARRDGRTRVMGAHVRIGGGSESWSARVGFQPAQTFVTQQLDVAGADRSLWDVQAPDGYHLVGWRDDAPEEILASFARARHAIEDSVDGDMTWENTDWTPERVRQEEADNKAAGHASWVMTAVHDASGEIVAVTELFVRDVHPERGFQGETSVVREHRGHGLGRAIKAALLRRLVVERPSLLTVATQTADLANMARINTEIGYQSFGEFFYGEADVADLEKHVGLG